MTASKLLCFGSAHSRYGCYSAGCLAENEIKRPPVCANRQSGNIRKLYTIIIIERLGKVNENRICSASK